MTDNKNKNTQSPIGESSSSLGGGRLSLERFVKIKTGYGNSLARLELLLSGKERVSFSGVDYTLYEIENLQRDLDWYESFMYKNQEQIRDILPSRTVPYFSKPIEARETMPAKKSAHSQASVRILPVIHVF